MYECPQCLHRHEPLVFWRNRTVCAICRTEKHYFTVDDAGLRDVREVARRKVLLLNFCIKHTNTLFTAASRSLEGKLGIDMCRVIESFGVQNIIERIKDKRP